MEINITNKTDNELLYRIEVDGIVNFEGATPSNSDLQKKLAGELKKDTNLVVIKNIYTTFSQQEAKFKAFVYENAKAKSKVEMKTKYLRKQAEENKKKADAEAAEKAEAEAKAKEEAKRAAEEEAKSEEVDENKEEGNQ